MGWDEEEKTEGRRMCRYRLSAFGEFYKISQEVLETEGTMASTVTAKETPLRDLTTQLRRCATEQTQAH